MMVLTVVQLLELESLLLFNANATSVERMDDNAFIHCYNYGGGVL